MNYINIILIISYVFLLNMKNKHVNKCLNNIPTIFYNNIEKIIFIVNMLCNIIFKQLCIMGKIGNVHILVLKLNQCYIISLIM